MGSPPRVREKHKLAVHDEAHLGITPACAGKTKTYLLQNDLGRDHPRVCGKNSVSFAKLLKGSGSPPRVREKLFDEVEKGHREGITPACAGKTHVKCRQHYVLWDHPRVCGKNSINQDVESARLGSPPRVREKPVSPAINSVEIGITPACAGKTTKKSWCCLLERDHPRVCGKNVLDQTQAFSRWGSPPRVREKPVQA